MKRKPIADAEQPDYPTLKSYRANRREFLKLTGIGLGGMAVGGCFREDVRTGGIICPPAEPPLAGTPMPPAPDDAPPLGGEIAAPENPPREQPALPGALQPTAPSGQDKPTPRLPGKPAPVRLRGEMPAPTVVDPPRMLGIMKPAATPSVKPESLPPEVPMLDGDIAISELPE
jgi:hypothetical protein